MDIEARESRVAHDSDLQNKRKRDATTTRHPHSLFHYDSREKSVLGQQQYLVDGRDPTFAQVDVSFHIFIELQSFSPLYLQLFSFLAHKPHNYNRWVDDNETTCTEPPAV